MNDLIEYVRPFPKCIGIFFIWLFPVDKIYNVFLFHLWYPENHEAIEFWMKIIQFILFSAFTIGGILSWKIVRKQYDKYRKRKRFIEKLDHVDHAADMSENNIL